MAQGAAEAVELPDDQGVAGPQVVQELLEDEAVGAGAAGGLGEHPITAGTFQRVDRSWGCWWVVETRAEPSRWPMPLTVA